jgi:hypothetical protein
MLTLLVASVCWFQSPDAVNDQPWRTQLVAVALEELNQTGIPSLQIAVGYDGEVVFEDAYDLANV